MTDTLQEERRPEDVVASSRRNFAKDRAYTEPPYGIFRGLTRETSYGGESYVEILPKFEGKTVIKHIDAEIARRKQAAHDFDEPFEKIHIVDVGYGSGIFLLDCANRWGEYVTLTGYGNDNYTKIPVDTAEGTIPPTEKTLEEKGIQLVNGNMIDIRKELGDNTADIIVSSYAAMYAIYPHWELVKKFYRTLKPDGLAFLHGFVFYSRNEDHNQEQNNAALESYLVNNNYQFEIFENGVSFRKTKPDIALPIRTGRKPGSLETYFPGFKT